MPRLALESAPTDAMERILTLIGRLSQREREALLLILGHWTRETDP